MNKVVLALLVFITGTCGAMGQEPRTLQLKFNGYERDFEKFRFHIVAGDAKNYYKIGEAVAGTITGWLPRPL